MGIKEKQAGLRPLPADIGERLEEVASVLRRHPVRLGYLFGSAARDPAAASDVDIAVLPERQFSYTAVYADLSTALATDRLDLADLRFATPLLQWQVVTGGRRLVVASELEAALYEQAARSRYRDHRVWWTSRAAIPGGTLAMTVRRDLVLESLAELERVAQELHKYRSVTTDALAADLSLRWTVERGLLAGLGIVFRVAEHILAAHFRRAPRPTRGCWWICGTARSFPKTSTPACGVQGGSATSSCTNTSG